MKTCILCKKQKHDLVTTSFCEECKQKLASLQDFLSLDLWEDLEEKDSKIDI